MGGDELAALGPDLSQGVPAFIVAGPALSGRSAVLASMTRSFLAGGTQVILATPGPGLLVMLDDTDAGNVVTAARAGAQ